MDFSVDSRTLVVIAIIVAVLAIAAIVILMRKHRSRQLREHFGTEYDRAVQLRGNRSEAETELVNREKRVHSFVIRQLSPETRNRYLAEWSVVQRRFVDDPALAVKEADSLVNQVMHARGFPMADFETRAADVSVTCPNVVQNYRAARDIAQRQVRGDAGTEDLRQAMVHYRSLFDELLDMTDSTAAKGVLVHQKA